MKPRLCFVKRAQKAPPVNTNVQPSFQAHANPSELVFRCFHPPRVVFCLPGWKTHARRKRACKKMRTARRNGRNLRMFRFSSIESSISLLAALKAVETVCDGFPRFYFGELVSSKVGRFLCCGSRNSSMPFEDFPTKSVAGDFPGALLTNHQMEITLDCGKRIG